MARNKVMKLWTAIVTAFLALCTTLGFVTRTTAPAVLQTEPERNSERIPHQRTASATSPASQAKALPPTMKQRIRAEAHGKTPAAATARSRTRRHHPPTTAPTRTRTRTQTLRRTISLPCSADPPAHPNGDPAYRPGSSTEPPGFLMSRRSDPHDLVPGTQKTPNRYRLGVHHAGGANRI